MHKVVSNITGVLGIIALLGTGLWCLAGAGMYGSPLAAFRGVEFLLLLLFLTVCPLSVLPAAIIGRKRPGIAGAWLIASGFVSPLLLLLMDLHGGLRFAAYTLQSLLPVLLLFLYFTPMNLLGLAFLWPMRHRIRDALRARLASPSFRKKSAAVATALTLIAILGVVISILRQPSWKVVVRSEGGRVSEIRFDPRHYMKMYPTMHGVFDALFEKAPAPGSRILGSYEVTGAKGPDGEPRIMTYSVTVERDEKGLLRVLRNGILTDGNWMYDRPALDCARGVAVKDVLEAAWKAYPDEPQ